jgi:hypothetical protein
MMRGVREPIMRVASTNSFSRSVRELGARQAANLDPTGDGDCQHNVPIAGAQARHDQESEQQHRQRRHHVDKAHDHEVNTPAAPASHPTHRQSHKQCNDLRQDGNAQRDAGGVDDTAVEITSVEVGSHPKLAAWKATGGADEGFVVIEVGDQRLRVATEQGRNEPVIGKDGDDQSAMTITNPTNASRLRKKRRDASR